MWWPFGKTMKIKCPDGREMIVFKNPDDAFPLIAKDWFARAEATVKAVTELQGGLGLELKKHIEGFFAELDIANRSIQFDFRGIYIAFLTNPCKWDGWLQKEIRKIIERESKLRKLGLEITRIESLRNQGLDEKALGQALMEALNRLTKSDIKEEMSSEFQKVEKNTSAWMEEIQ